MKIIVDAMGGDNAPLEIVKGALQAQKRFGVDIVFTGDEAAILDAVRAYGLTELPDGAAIIPTAETVEMCDDPATVFRRKKDTSMGVGLTLLKTAAATPWCPPAPPARCSPARHSSPSASTASAGLPWRR